jgi:hypothetical protein
MRILPTTLQCGKKEHTKKKQECALTELKKNVKNKQN